MRYLLIVSCLTALVACESPTEVSSTGEPSDTSRRDGSECSLTVSLKRFKAAETIVENRRDSAATVNGVCPIQDFNEVGPGFCARTYTVEQVLNDRWTLVMSNGREYPVSQESYNATRMGDTLNVCDGR